VGIALDPARRLDQHNGLAPGGAKSTRPGRPWRIATTHGPYPDRSSATKAEHVLKSQRGAKRLAWRPPPGE
jgi:putative endonuclease